MAAETSWRVSMATTTYKGWDWTIDKNNNVITMGDDGLHRNRGTIKGYAKITQSLLKSTYPNGKHPTDADKKLFDGTPIFVHTNDPGHPLPFLLSSIAYVTFPPSDPAKGPSTSITHLRARTWCNQAKKKQTMTQMWGMFLPPRVSSCATLCYVSVNVQNIPGHSNVWSCLAALHLSGWEYSQP
jgi:hypothetical protein